MAGASLQDWWQRIYMSRNCSTTDVALVAFARGQVLGVLNRKDVLVPPDMGAFLRLELAQALSNLRDLNRHIQRSKVLTSNTCVCSSRPPRMQSNPSLSKSAQCQGGRPCLAPRTITLVAMTAAWNLQCGRPPKGMPAKGYSEFGEECDSRSEGVAAGA